MEKVAIKGWARRFLERPLTFATLATISPDGSPFQAVIWFELRGDAVVVNSRVGRRWPSNLLREPRFSLAIEDGYEWIGLRGEAEALSDPAEAQADIAAMTRRYHADDPAKIERLIGNFEAQHRISFLLRPSAITEHPDD